VSGIGDSSLWWSEDGVGAGAIVTIDQRALPARCVELRIDAVDDLIEAIAGLAIRGAPAIGLAGALGVALAARTHGCADEAARQAVTADARRIAAARPTAVNLRWAVERVLGKLADGPDAMLAEAERMVAEDRRTNALLATRAADVALELTGKATGLRVLTHCNTGRFATAAIGTALGGIMELSRRGALRDVLVDETRPLLQGARLTAFELREARIPHRLCVDAAAASAMARGEVDIVIVGADRIAANGDTANKIGTYPLAIAAARHNIPFVVVAPESTWDRGLADGRGIVIEDRADHEVTHLAGAPTAPEGTATYNPAFDVTPADLIAAIVSDTGVARPRAGAQAICDMSRALYERGWMPGTSGNISTRTDAETFAITASGRDKGALTPADIVGAHVEDASATDPAHRPSAEASIHAAVYRATDARAVIHVHAPYATALASRFEVSESVARVGLAQYELTKGLGLGDISAATLPIFANWDDVDRIADDVCRHLTGPTGPRVPALLIGRHGVTVWGRSLAQARNRLECVEAIAQLIDLETRR
jgi:methylthioribose-1-phosphate isomerase